MAVIHDIIKAPFLVQALTIFSSFFLVFFTLLREVKDKGTSLEKTYEGN